MSITAHQLAEAQALLSQGWKQAAIAAYLGLTAPTLCRLLQRAANGEEIGPRHQTGPRDEHTLTTAERSALKLCLMQKNSRRLAAQMLIEHADCTDETAAKLVAVFDRAEETRSNEQWPTWFTRACTLTTEEKLSFRGAKAMAAVEPARPRGRFYEFQGKTYPMHPNALWEFDDESENTPWVEMDEDGRARLNRQTLKAIDYDSAFYLGMRAISKDSDGYGLEDQADFFHELVDAFGMPLRVRIERGPWDNNFWFGVGLRSTWQTPETADYRFGGIDLSAGGPVGVLQAFKSRHKGLIEGSFNHRQNLAAHETLDIGRFRGEHEKAAKQVTAAQNLRRQENLERAVAQFPTASARADISLDVMHRFNSELKLRRNYWGHKKMRPTEVYATCNPVEWPAEERWRLLPVKKTATHSKGHVSITVKGQSYLFSSEGIMPTWDWQAYLPDGWRLFVVFHPQRLDLGARIFNAVEPTSPLNPGRYPLGMPLGILPAAKLAPAFSDQSGDFTGRNRTLKAIRTETRLTNDAAKGVKVTSVIAAGRSRTVRTGSADPLRQLSGPAAEAPAPARREADDAAALAEVEAARATRIARLRQLEAEDALF